MKIAVISDLHGNLITYPSDYWYGLDECEVMFICGDIFPLYCQFDMKKCLNWIIDVFEPWAESLPVEKVFIIAGNHDAWFEKNEFTARMIFPLYNKVVYLQNDYTKYLSNNGQTYTIFGTPYCHIFGNWPFMREEETLVEYFDKIPENLDILFSHDAPYGTSDICFEGWSADGEHKGCPALRDAVLNKKPKYHFHGHLHSSNHDEELLETTKVYNTSILNEDYKVRYYPLILDI